MSITGFSRIYAFFEEQFEPKDGGFLYRKDGKGPAYLVSKAERDAFVSRFKWSMRSAAAAMALVMAGSIAVLLLRSDQASHAAITAVTICSVALGLIPWFLIYRYAMHFPGNSVLGRSPVSPALSSEEVKRKFFRKLSYRQLALLPLISLVWLAPGHGGHGWLNPMHGTARLWWLAFAAFVVLAGIQAYRKWRFEKSDYS